MPAAIPGSTHVHESEVLPFPLESVWNLAIRPCTFDWLRGSEVTGLTKVTVENGSQTDIGAHRVFHYKEMTQRAKIMEISDFKHKCIWEVVESEPAVSVSAAMHSIRLRPVTSTNSTLIEWVSIFSNDASQEVLQDSKYKKRDGFQLLLKYLENNLAKSATGGLKRERSQSPGKRTPAKK